MLPATGPASGTRSGSQGDTNPTAGKTREELIRATISTVHDERTAKEFLERRCYVIAGEEYSLSSLSLALLHLSQTSALTKVVVDGLRAAAYVLEGLNTESTAIHTAEAINDLLKPTTEQLMTTIAELQRTTSDLCASAVSITRTADEFNENTGASISYLTDAAVEASVAAEAMEAAAKALPLIPIPTPIVPNPPVAPSYAAAVAGSHLHPSHATTLARGDSRTRQVLVDKAPGASVSGLEELTERELVGKASLAIEQLELTEKVTHPGAKFIGA